MEVSAPPSIVTPRLLLRQWRPTDWEPFAHLNSDPVVMEYFPSPLERAQSNLLAQRFQRGIAERGWGMWAVELTNSGEFCGFVGLNPVPFEAAFTPAVEVGWRLAHRFWGRGIASEAARAALAFGFDNLGLREIVSFTAVLNRRSQRVMQKIGMTCDEAGGFAHPGIEPTHPLLQHVLYRISEEEFHRGLPGY